GPPPRTIMMTDRALPPETAPWALRRRKSGIARPPRARAPAWRNPRRETPSQYRPRSPLKNVSIRTPLAPAPVYLMLSPSDSWVVTRNPREFRRICPAPKWALLGYHIDHAFPRMGPASGRAPLPPS